MSTLLVVVASTRPTRVGPAVAEWFVGIAVEDGRFDVEVADLADVDLPLLDEPHHPRLGRYVEEHTRAWSHTVGASDAFVFVTPEYNHGYPAPLKNALDFLHHEWRYKPAGFVSYGGLAGGARAVEQLKPVVSALRMVPVADAVSVPFVARAIDASGRFAGSDALTAAAEAMLDELARLRLSPGCRRLGEVSSR